VRSAFSVLSIALLLTVAAGCPKPEGGASTSASRSTSGRLFGVSFQTMNNPFFVDLNQGIEEVVKAHGDRLATLDAQFNSLKQRNDISDLVLQDAATIFINPVMSEGMTGSLRQAHEKSIPCIIVDAPAKDLDLVLCTVASDNVKAGRLAAQALAKVCRPARIVVLHHSVNKACRDRVQGFTEEIAKYPDMKILDTQEGKGTTEGARPVMLDLMGRYADLNAVFPINDPSALGCVSALESADKLKGVSIVTVDGSQEALAAIKAGKIVSTSAQFPKEIGRIAAEKAYESLEGKPVDKDVVVRVELITKENVEQFVKK
jgi:ABC-type sugar transport system substrate-binding protein